MIRAMEMGATTHEARELIKGKQSSIHITTGSAPRDTIPEVNDNE